MVKSMAVSREDWKWALLHFPKYQEMSEEELEKEVDEDLAYFAQKASEAGKQPPTQSEPESQN